MGLFLLMEKDKRAFDWRAAVAIVAGIGMLALMFARWQAAVNGYEHPAPSATRIARGHALYVQNCRCCHGDQGHGDGPAAVMLDPRPRDFNLGKFRLISTASGIPTRENLIHTIRNGMAGTSMPAWMMLPQEDLESLADYVLSVTRDAMTVQMSAHGLKGKKLETIVDNKMTPGAMLVIPAETPVDAKGLARGKELYLVTCAKCHGDDGSGKSDPTWKTAEGYPIVSRNFTSGVYKGGGKATDLYTRVYAGLPGTPMPGFGSAYPPADLWAIVHYVQTLAQRPTKAAAVASGGQ
jgi:mono/diheme cytochrome c family protein